MNLLETVYVNKWPSGVEIGQNFEISNFNMSILNLKSFTVIKLVV